MKKRVGLLALLIISALIMGLSGCDKKAEPTETSTRETTSAVVSSESPAEQSAREAAEILSSGDSTLIGDLIFGSYESEEREAIAEILGESAPSGEGILNCIFARVSVSVQKATEQEIIYEIKAPNMRNIFHSLGEKAGSITEEELRQYFAEYAEKAELRTETVSLECAPTEGKLTVNYRDETFVNALTGGLLEAYQELYQEILDTYEKEGD